MVIYARDILNNKKYFINNKQLLINWFVMMYLMMMLIHKILDQYKACSTR